MGAGFCFPSLLYSSRFLEGLRHHWIVAFTATAIFHPGKKAALFSIIASNVGVVYWGLFILKGHFEVLRIDKKNQVIRINKVAIWVLSSCPIHPREVFKPAILANAAGVILLHNPSGDPNPLSLICC